MIGKIERVPLRDVWKHEALDFTAWLRDNIDVLNEVLDVSLATAEKEQAAGDFSVDLVAQDESGGVVVIENQLEKSNHDHLGKLVTYLAAYDAKAAVWIVADARPEHVAAVSWLNQSTAAAFYLVKVDAVRIGESKPALLPTLIVGPSPESKAIGETKGELAATDELRKRFFLELQARARERISLHNGVTPRGDNWLSASAGKTGLGLSYFARKHDAEVHLWIDTGDGDTNRLIYDQFLASKDDIETKFGGSLEWDQHEARRACVVRAKVSVGGYRDEDRWPEIHDAMIDAMVRLETALRPHISGLKT